MTFKGLLGFVFLGVVLYEEYMITQCNSDTTQRIFIAILTQNTKKCAISVT